MPAKRTPTRKRSASSSLSPAPKDGAEAAPRTGDSLKKPRLSKTKANDHSHPVEEYQQVTKVDFVERYKLEEAGGGDCYYMPDMISKEESQKWYDALIGSKDYQPTLKLYGRDIVQSRHIAAYSTVSSLPLKYSGTQINMVYPFPPEVEEMRKRVEEVLSVQEGTGEEQGDKDEKGKGKVRFNHCMMNRYEDGTVYIGKHSDNIENKVIASVSLGAERTFILHPREPSKRSQARASAESGSTTTGLDKRKPVRFKLGDGSLFVMQGRTQEFWKHEIPKEPKIKEGRISLTFRQLVYD